MKFASLLLFVLSKAWALDVQLESSYQNNPDNTFIPFTRSAYILGPSLEYKLKFKKEGYFFLVLSKLDYKHDFQAKHMRKGEASTSLLAIKPYKSFLFGGSFSGGHLWRWQRDYNTSLNLFQNLDGDHYFTEMKFFAEKNFTEKILGEISFSGRLEEFSSSYSVYVEEQNDNIGLNIASALAYKLKSFEVKPSVGFSKKLWRERNALNAQGAFVSSGEELKPDRIDTLMTALKNTLKFNNSILILTPQWTRVSDLSNDGRSWSGPGIMGELSTPIISSIMAKIKLDWSKREYDTQLSTFLSSGSKTHVSEALSASVSASTKLENWVVEALYKTDKSISNQIDSQLRKIGNIKASTTNISFSRSF